MVDCNWAEIDYGRLGFLVGTEDHVAMVAMLRHGRFTFFQWNDDDVSPTQMDKSKRP